MPTVSRSKVKKINAPGLGRLPAFAHATVVGDQIWVSGTLGTREEVFELVDGGMAEQTRQTLRNVEKILASCGAGLNDIAKVNVFVTDMDAFPEMNRVYLEVFRDNPPARITVGCQALALDALIEIDCVAYKPS